MFGITCSCTFKHASFLVICRRVLQHLYHFPIGRLFQDEIQCCISLVILHRNIRSRLYQQAHLIRMTQQGRGSTMERCSSPSIFVIDIKLPRVYHQPQHYQTAILGREMQRGRSKYIPSSILPICQSARPDPRCHRGHRRSRSIQSSISSSPSGSSW
jgi:hypothetical protein